MHVTTENLDEFFESKEWWDKRCPPPNMDDLEVEAIQTEILKFPSCQILQIGTFYGWTAFNVMPQLNQVNGFLHTIDQHSIKKKTGKIKSSTWSNHVNRIIDTHDLNWIMKLHTKGSDRFFKTNKQHFHVIFVDGGHRYEQAKRDLSNSLKCLHPGGTIFCHDCYDSDEIKHQAKKAFLDVRAKDYTKKILDTEYSLGVLKWNQS